MFRWGGVLVGSVDGVVGPDVSKRRGLKSRWPGVSSRNRAMTRCFRCVSGVLSVSRCMVPGLISSVLDTWPPQCAVPTPEQGHPGGPGWGGALEGVWALSWTRACTANAGSRPITRVRASSSGTKPALKAAAPADGQNPHQLQPSLRGAPGSTNRASRPTTLEDRPSHNRHNLQKHKRAHEQAYGRSCRIRAMCFAGIRRDLRGLVEGSGRQPLDLTSAQYYLNHLQRGRRRQIAQP